MRPTHSLRFGFTCPLFRQHGERPTEIWLLGNTSYAAIVKVMNLRTKFEPYVLQGMAQARDTGRPFNRPLFFDFPNDALSWQIKDQYMMGDDYLVAPVITPNATSRTLYLPSGATWRNYFTGTETKGGQNITVPTPLDEFPLFSRVPSQ